MMQQGEDIENVNNYANSFARISAVLVMFPWHIWNGEKDKLIV